VSPFLNNSPKHVAAEGLFSQLANRQIFVANHSEELTHNLKAEKLAKSFNSCAALLSFLPPECSLEQVKSLFETKKSKKGKRIFLAGFYWHCFIFALPLLRLKMSSVSCRKVKKHKVQLCV